MFFEGEIPFWVGTSGGICGASRKDVDLMLYDSLRVNKEANWQSLHDIESNASF